MTNLHDLIISRIVEDLPAGLLVIDPDGVIVTVSPATSNLLGIPSSQILGHGWGEIFFGSEENDQFNQLFLDVIQKEPHSLRQDVCYKTGPGEILRLNVRSSFIRHEGKLVAIVVLLNDITDLYRAQEAERQLMLERVHQQDEKIESLSRLAQSIAHQVRNPASAIGGFARRLEGVLKSHGLVSEYPSIILEEAVRLEGIVGAVVRLGSLKKTCAAELESSAIIDKCLAHAEEYALAQGKRIVPTIRILKPRIYADAVLLAQAIEEVLLNSVDFSATDAVPVDILVGAREGATLVAITDQGPGISIEAQPYVFDPFFTTKSRGSGLGLSVARQIVLEHGGEISAGSGPHENSTIIEMILPDFSVPRSMPTRETSEP